MNIEILTLADNVQQYEGKLVIVGTFNDIKAPQIPHIVPEMVVASKIEFRKDENNKHSIELKIINNATKENVIKPIKAEIPILPIMEDTNDFIYLNFITNINNTVFNAEGLYDVVLKVDDVEKKTHLKINIP